MKNIEKYPNTKGALDAYNKLNSRESFETWLELEFEETREQSLLECERCPYNQGSSFRCKFVWLYAKDGKEETK